MAQEATKVMSALSIPALCSLGPGRFPHSPALLTKMSSKPGSRSCASSLTGSEGRSVRFWWEIPEVLTGQLVWQLAQKKPLNIHFGLLQRLYQCIS